MTVFGNRPPALLAALMLLMAMLIGGAVEPLPVSAGRSGGFICHAGDRTPSDTPPMHDRDCGLCPLCSLLSNVTLLPAAGGSFPMPRIAAAERTERRLCAFVRAADRFTQPRAPPISV
jgi:hypothetical protein